MTIVDPIITQKLQEGEEDIDKLFDKIFLSADGKPNFENMCDIFIRTHLNPTTKEAFESGIRIGWGLAKVQN